MKALLSGAVDEWSKDNAQRLGASLAFYSLLSASPLLVMMVAVAALVFGQDAVRGQVASQLTSLLGPVAAPAIEALLLGAHHFSSGTVPAVISLLTLLFGASSVLVELQDALNIIWGSTAANSGASTFVATAWSFVKGRFFSFLLVIGSGLLLVLSLIWSAWIAAMGKWFGSFLAIPEPLLHLANFAISFVAITIVFAAIYKVVPNIRLKWSDVLVGASVTSLVFTIGKVLIGIYLGKESFASTYGAAGSLVVLLVWVYYSAQLFFFGAEFTKVYTHRHGSLAAQQLPRRPE